MVYLIFSPQSLQNDLEAEQVKVNSLTHMVVIVDENSCESATAVLEDQLQVRTPKRRMIPRHLSSDSDYMLPLFFLSHLTVYLKEQKNLL